MSPRHPSTSSTATRRWPSPTRLRFVSRAASWRVYRSEDNRWVVDVVGQTHRSDPASGEQHLDVRYRIRVWRAKPDGSLHDPQRRPYREFTYRPKKPTVISTELPLKALCGHVRKAVSSR